MGYLGDLGVAHDPVDETFGYFGATVRVHPDLTDVAILDVFAGLGELDPDTDAVGVMHAVRDAVAALVHPDDTEMFWRQARAHRQGVEDIGKVAAGLLEALSDRPTKLPGDSSSGQPNDATSSGDSSSLVASALALLDGRPDLQAAVERAAEALASD